MAPNSITWLSALLPILIFFLHLNSLNSIEIPTISASPAVLPYVESPPNISSFFPSAWPSRSAASPVAPVPSSGEFVGKSCSGSVEFNPRVAAFAMALCFCLLVCNEIRNLVYDP